MHMQKKSQGFTIIELLVVIAIIAVLAGIVLVNVTTFINKGKNAAIKGNLSTILVNSASHFDTNNSYSGFCATSAVTIPQAAITAAGGTSTCEVSTDNSKFCACSTTNVTTLEPTGTTICVDSNGAKKQTTTACATECPAGANTLCV